MAINPLWWLHSRVSGTPRANLLMMLGYVGIVLVFATISYRMVETPPGMRPDYGAYYGIWLGIITAAQFVFALIMIPSAIKKAVQRDYQNGMAESHRLTPLSSMAIVRGYLVGPALPPLLLFAAGLLIGSFFAAKSTATLGLSVKLSMQIVLAGWVAVNGMVLVFALMVASVSLLSAIAVREGKFNILGLLIAGSFVGGWVAVMFVPGLALITGAMSGSLLMSIFGKNTALGDQSTVISTAALQLTLSVTFLLAAGHKFRAPDRPIFALPLSLALAVIWGLALVLGVIHSSAPGFADMGFEDINSVHLAFSLFAFLVIALFALHAAAAGRLRLDRVALFTNQPLGSARLGRSAMPAAITAMALVVVVCMVVAMNAKHQLPDSLSALLRDARVWGAVAAAVLLSCWTDYFLFYWAAANRIKMWLILLIGWGVMKILPVLVDGVLLEVSAQLYEHPWEWYGALTAVSPLGTIILTKGDASWSIVLGLASQLGFVLFMGSVCIRTQRRLVDRVTTYTAQADPTALASIAFADVENPASPPSE